jgi:hypothetical protein
MEWAVVLLLASLLVVMLLCHETAKLGMEWAAVHFHPLVVLTDPPMTPMLCKTELKAKRVVG